ncbi:hypothetical protein [Planctomycetes bacterium K23_9]|uniref:YokE-like PH domain-containing protein n=1 Tax=Stieleria marina TaxID=1930275 RepID=A0A517NN58_9BACT|nr:hypothetical protein K239x_05020 [Planctomycetes bacterium K23_9]
MAATELTDGEVTEKLRSINIDVTTLPFPVDESKCFPKLGGMGWKGDVKKRIKLLHACQDQLQKTLKEGEEVLYIGKGVQQKFVEQYFMGIWAQFINQTVFVFTNLRVILLNSNTKGVPKHQFWSIYYNEIAKFKGGFMGGSQLKLLDGSKFSYSGFKGHDKKAIPKVVEHARQEYATLGFTPQSTQSRETLCCQCVEVVPKETYQCGNCGQTFYKPTELALRSLIFPSWGDFSMGHTLLALIELAGYLLSWFIFAAAIVAAINDPEAIGGAVVLGAFVVLAHVLDAILTYYIAKKGLSPRKS